MVKKSFVLSFFILSIFLLFLLLFTSNSSSAADIEYNETRACFENFIRCELTRTSAKNFFDGKNFTISMVNFFDIKKEGDLIIVTGAVECWVEKEHRNLFIAVGLQELLEKRKVSYLTIRKKDFSIIATQLMRYPYKERCDWSQYWIDID